MLTRCLPLALVLLAACEPGGGAANAPPAIAPKELVDAVLESPGDGSDILDALAEFKTAEEWRKSPTGLVVTERTLEAMVDAAARSRLIGEWERRYTPHEDVRVSTKSGLEKPREILQQTFTFRPDGTCTAIADWLLEGGCPVDRGLATIRADGVAEWAMRVPTTRRYPWKIVSDESAKIVFIVDDEEDRTIVVDVVGPDELRGVDECGSFRMVRVKDAK